MAIVWPIFAITVGVWGTAAGMPVTRAHGAGPRMEEKTRGVNHIPMEATFERKVFGRAREAPPRGVLWL